VAAFSRLAGPANKSLSGLTASRPTPPVAKLSRSLSDLLSNSTIGVALIDRNLSCTALNGALRGMLGISAKKQLGKQLHQVFPGDATELEVAFRLVWTTRNSLFNLELTAPSRPGPAPRRWLVNFYPITDESARVRLVAATFSEVTKGRSVELNLSRLKEKFHSDDASPSDLPEEEFFTLSARTFELVKRSVALLKGSLSLRFHMSEMRMETQLLRHALFMTPNPVQNPVLLPSAVSSDRTPTEELESPELSRTADCSPSPRERQILCLLADGKSSKEIGSALDISCRTVESYRARIMLKLDLHSTAALVRYAIRNKIVEA
jgi:DNA-binding CsgD family transcriptional regulator